MSPIPRADQRSLTDRLMQLAGGSYTPEQRRKYYISGPQWAGAYEGQALFHAPTREPVGFEEVIRHLGDCLLYTSPSPRDRTRSRMPSSA